MEFALSAQPQVGDYVVADPMGARRVLFVAARTTESRGVALYVRTGAAPRPTAGHYRVFTCSLAAANVALRGDHRMPDDLQPAGVVAFDDDLLVWRWAVSESAVYSNAVAALQTVMNYVPGARS